MEEKYLVPKNVSTKFEIIDGIGMKELGILLVSVLVGVGITSLTGDVLYVIFISFVAFMLIRVDDTGFNLLAMIKSFYEYTNSQQFYEQER